MGEEILINYHASLSFYFLCHDKYLNDFINAISNITNTVIFFLNNS